MNTIIAYVMAYLPTITAVVTTVATVIVSIKKLKETVTDNAKGNTLLAKALEKAEKERLTLEKKLDGKITQLEELVALKTKESETLLKQQAELIAQNKQMRKLVDECTTLRNQVTAVLERKGE